MRQMKFSTAFRVDKLFNFPFDLETARYYAFITADVDTYFKDTKLSGTSVTTIEKCARY